MLKKLRTKFILTNMAIVAAMLVVIFVLVFQFTAMDMQRQEEAMLRTMLQADQPRERKNPPPGDISLPHFILQLHPDGMVSAQGVTDYDLTDRLFLSQLLTEVRAQAQTTGLLQQYGLRYLQHTGPGPQRIAFVDVSSQHDSLVSLLQVSFLVAAVSLALFWGISILLARWAVRPVEQAWQQQRQFVSDASHELKTPLSVILSNVDMLENEQLDEASRRRFTRNISTMAAHMRKLVESLLELARVDNAQVKKSFAPLDFSQLVEAAVLPFEPLFFERGLELCSTLTPALRVNGSASYLHQVVDILLDNALKYADGGQVALIVQRHGRNACQLRLTTAGDPIGPDQAKKLFDRFYRTDPARSRDGSFGLGLAIAQGVVAEHGGQIWLESGDFGNCFIIQLPTL